ncbi:Ferritin [Aphelenchoides besseyi]|nr:Ferritin [Aphelenchoides besseyi]KAI6210277.1 Ferritin [Aphelenchoides besseyi]
MPGEESTVRQNFHADSEAAINKQINIELYASYVYLAMSYYFDRHDVAMPNLSKWCKKQSEEERSHAETFMKYQNTRGGRVVLQQIEKPEKDEYEGPLEAMQSALALEKYNNKSLLELHEVSTRCNDPQMCDFIEDKFLRDQVESIEEIGNYITQLKKAGSGLGEFLFDKEFNS